VEGELDVTGLTIWQLPWKPKALIMALEYHNQERNTKTCQKSYRARKSKTEAKIDIQSQRGGYRERKSQSKQL